MWPVMACGMASLIALFTHATQVLAVWPLPMSTFFSRSSLAGKVSEQYEPYIYNALRTEEEVTAAIEAVTFEEANAAAKTLLDPAQMTAAFVARSEGIEEEAKALLGG